MRFRLALFAAVCSLLWIVRMQIDNCIEPRKSAALSVRALNGNDQDQANLLNSKSVFDWTDAGLASVALLTAGGCFSSSLRRGLHQGLHQGVHRASRPEGK